MSTKPEASSEKPKRKYTRSSDRMPPIDPEIHAKNMAELDEKIGVVKSKIIEPQKDIAAGDKTPAYVEWFCENHTEEEFDAKYGHRKMGDT